VAVLLVLVVAAVVLRSVVDAGDGSEVSGSGKTGNWTAEVAPADKLLAVDGDTVCATSTSEVVCLDAATGVEQLAVPVDKGLPTSPVLLDDRLLLGTSTGVGGGLFAYARDGGEELWDVALSVGAERELPVVDGVVTVTDGEQLVGVDVATGDRRWENYTTDETEDPHVSGRDVFTDGTRVYTAIQLIDAGAGDVTGHIVAVDPASGAEIWRSPQLGDIGYGAGAVAAAPFDDGAAVAFLMEGYPGRVLVLDSATGQIRWEVDLTSDYASVVHLDGSTIVADGATTRSYDADGRQEWEVASPVIERNPDLIGPGDLVVDRGRLFVAGYDVYELDPTDGAADRIRKGVSASDVAIVGDRLIIVEMGQVVARSLSEIGD
jgi:outer membrane protein assembly factor BamB